MYLLIIGTTNELAQFDNHAIRVADSGVSGGSEKAGAIRATNRFGVEGYVSEHNWGLTEANVACRQLGFPLGARGYTRTSKRYYSTNATYVPTEARSVFSVRCRGYEARIQDCAHSSKQGAISNGVAGVICRSELVTKILKLLVNVTITVSYV